MTLRQSDNYFWSVNDIIGQGATGNVYICRSKNSGAAHAAKVFNHMGLMRPFDVRIREVEVLKKLDHPNIVKLDNVESEHGSRATVIVMELCETSLYTILEQPENFNGLPEEHFKDVFKDMANGMDYLRGQNIVHRDVKPGNILRVQQANGKHIYKLTDFGAARELKEHDQSFMSLYGTEEYLHPDVYERAVMKNLSGKKFTAAVDLWSMGVTLYHAATGQLPFRPYGGRQNKISMFEIISTKGPGVISGVQKKERGSIEYDTKLPETTWISQGLKDLITPALQELMETNPVKDDQMITFDVFFKRVKDVFLRKVVNLYCASSSTFHKVYLNPGENLAKLQELIAYQTGISAAKQELFHSHERFQPDQMAHADAYPDMTDENPLIIIGGEPIPAEQLAFRRIPNLPKVHRDKTSIDDDANIAKVYANICFVYKTTSETLDCTCKVILKMEGIIGDVLRKEVGDANNFLQHFEEHFKTKNDLIERERKDLDQLKDACRCWSEEIDTDDEKPQTKGADQSYKEFLEKLRSLILWLENGFTCPSFKGLRQKLKTAEWRSTIEKQVNDVKDIFTRFTKDRQLTRRPSNMDDLIHRADKDRLTACVVEIKKQISEVQEYRAALHTKFFEWFGEVWHRKLELERCKQNLEEFAVQYEGRMNSELVRIEGEKKKLFVDIKTKEPQQQQQPQSKQLIDCDRINEELKPLEVLVKEVLKLAEDGHQKLEKTQTLFDQLNSSES